MYVYNDILNIERKNNNTDLQDSFIVSQYDIISAFKRTLYLYICGLLDHEDMMLAQFQTLYCKCETKSKIM